MKKGKVIKSQSHFQKFKVKVLALLLMLPMIDGRIEVFNSAIATFHAPSDISGIAGMRREHIRAMPSWRNGPARYDTVLIILTLTKMLRGYTRLK